MKQLPDLMTSPSCNMFDKDILCGLNTTRISNSKRRDSRVEPIAVIQPNKNSISPDKSLALIRIRKKAPKNSENKLKIKTIRASQHKEAHAKNVLKSIITSSVTKIRPMKKFISPRKNEPGDQTQGANPLENSANQTILSS